MAAPGKGAPANTKSRGGRPGPPSASSSILEKIKADGLPVTFLFQIVGTEVLADVHGRVLSGGTQWTPTLAAARPRRCVPAPQPLRRRRGRDGPESRGRRWMTHPPRRRRSSPVRHRRAPPSPRRHGGRVLSRHGVMWRFQVSGLFAQQTHVLPHPVGRRDRFPDHLRVVPGCAAGSQRRCCWRSCWRHTDFIVVVDAGAGRPGHGQVLDRLAQERGRWPRAL